MAKFGQWTVDDKIDSDGDVASHSKTVGLLVQNYANDRCLY